MRLLIFGTLFLFAFHTTDSYAQSSAQELGTCLTDNTSGKDRKNLARWIFAAMSAHPEIQALADVTEAERNEASRVAGELLTRLLAESCTEHVRVAMEAGDSAVIEAGFGILGEVAMQELMLNPEVSTAMGEMVSYIDLAQLEAALEDE